MTSKVRRNSFGVVGRDWTDPEVWLTVETSESRNLHLLEISGDFL